MAIIYKITNKINNKIYIGETTRNLNVRWNEHKHEALSNGHGYNYHIHNAMRKYGIDNFNIEIIDNCPDEERFKLETKYIKEYNSTNPDIGYNTVVEGEGSTLIATETILEAWKEGLTIKETAELLGIHKSTVSHRLHACNISEDEIKNRFSQSVKDRCSYIVEQYDLSGNFVREWGSASECGRNGYSQTMISNVCRQEQITAHGYIWKYKQDERDIKEWVDKVKNKKQAGKPKKRTIQMDESHNIIHIYDSASEAAQALGIEDKSNICAACRKGRKAYGFYWTYEKE